MQTVAGAALNERLSFLVAATVAGISASVLPCLLLPSSPLCSGAADLASYAGAHLSLSIVLWFLAFGTAWILTGPRLIRPRQNLSTKLRLLGWSAVIGIIIDGAVTIYQFVHSTDVVSVLTPDNLIGLAGRGLLYVIAFAIGIGLCWLIGGSHKSIETPPPRFGRD